VNEEAWSPLSDTDPVPGDPWKVNELGSHLVEQAEKIRDMVSDLKKVQADDIKSVFINSMVEKRDEVIPDLKLLAERYETSGNALRVYSDVLDRAQELAKQARIDSWDAQRRITAAQQAIAAANPTVMSAANAAVIAAPVPPVGPVIGPDHEEALRQAKADLDKAERLLDEAIELRDRAAGAARTKLDDANDDDLKNPKRGFFSPVSSMWDSVWHLPKNVGTLTAGALAITGKVLTDPIGSVVGVAKWTAESFTSLENFSSHLGLVGAALGIAGIFFPPTTLIATIGFAISATKLGVDTYLAANGKASWGDVALGAIGMATFGATRVAAQTAKARALKDTTEAVKRLRQVADTLPEGLDAANQAKLLKAENIVRALRNEEFSNRTLPTLTRWGNVIKDPGAPSKGMLQFSSSAQKIVRVSRGVAVYDKIDGKIGKAGAIAAWADELKPTAKDFAP
jgi:hypothetical protein